ncbi:GNAT family N-acetyltransferase [Arthrobacter psychrochitiniphilus]|uniref:N-acetyltransferase n=1 Tax=Arthrobacter psychrochitiniphilus TaxID=291045 RepID=A0A2V3DQ47_9MICC|nr:GNAT family protein [Arthrobacter psychrochitiniphilus]NYG16932.1 RimJ/RimL family protein N-acetyltransferase [Arthrobacter psychrochitiniphilus]PXA64831.1 N-acetyltransferase [Arthrobacter psychrochitiniphilus]
MSETFTLTSNRVSLQPFTEHHLDARIHYQALPEVARYLYRSPLTPEATRESALANRERRFESPGDRLLFAVVRNVDNILLGEVVATLENPHACQIEIGWIFDPGSAGRGYATEAAKTLLTYLFTAENAHRVFARLDAENDASRRLCERLGMREEAHLIENDRDGDRWGSEYVYAILAREFEPAQAQKECIADSSSGSSMPYPPLKMSVQVHPLPRILSHRPLPSGMRPTAIHQK